MSVVQQASQDFITVLRVSQIIFLFFSFLGYLCYLKLVNFVTSILVVLLLVVEKFEDSLHLVLFPIFCGVNPDLNLVCIDYVSDPQYDIPLPIQNAKSSQNDLDVASDSVVGIVYMK